MFFQYFKIAFRNLARQKLVSFINIFGLGIAMSVGLLQGVVLQHETDYDRFHPHPERSYRILSELTQANGSRYTLASSPLPLATAFPADSNQIEASVLLQPFSAPSFTIGDKELNFNGAFVQGDFFKVFGFTLEKGNPATALSTPGSLILSHTAASRYFGTEDPMGKSIQLPHQAAMMVTGVIHLPPGKTHLDLDGFSCTHSADTGSWFDPQKAYTYLLLSKNAKKAAIEGKLAGITRDMNRRSTGTKFAFELQALDAIRPSDRQLYNDIGGGTSWTKLNTGITVSLVVLLAACFNYINLAIARALSRAKEVGVRKIIGAKRRQVFAQYLVDSFISAALALAFAWLLLSFIISYAPFNDDYEMIPSAWTYNGYFIIGSIVFAAFTALLAGVVPALILSAFKPLKVMKNLRSVKIFGKMGLQKTLIVFQYSLSLIILIFLLTFFRQFQFMGNQDMHFKQDNLLVVDLQGMDGRISAQQLEKLASVKELNAASSLFNPHFNGFRLVLQSNLAAAEKQSMNLVISQPGFLQQIGVEWIAGKNLPSGNENGAYLVANETAARRLGFAQPQDAAGATVVLEDSSTATITGIIRDFDYEKSGRRVDPLLFRSGKKFTQLYVTVEPDNIEQTKQRIIAAWPLTGSKQKALVSTLADDIARNNSQKGTLSLLSYLAFIAFSIASLGLLGLVLFSVETRRKEVGIRKVIGASRMELIRVLSGGFVKLLLISGGIAIPIGYALGFFFLQNFLERVGFLFPFALACFAAMFGIGLLTIGSQTMAVTAQNPVNALREE